MRSSFSLFICLVLVSPGCCAIITGSCELDSQCGRGTCCAVSLWIRSLRMCTPMGLEGESCHPMSHKVPYDGKRLHHTCPCSSDLDCITAANGQYKCLSPHKSHVYDF